MKKKLRIATMLLTVVMAIAGFGMNLKAATIGDTIAVGDFQCKVGVVYDGEMMEDELEIIKYTGTAENVVIPTGQVDGGYWITAIGPNAFSDAQTVKKVAMTDQVYSIDENAFAGRENDITIHCEYDDCRAYNLAMNKNMKWESHEPKENDYLTCAICGLNLKAYGKYFYDKDSDCVFTVHEDENELQTFYASVWTFLGNKSEVIIPEKYKGAVVTRLDSGIYSSIDQITKLMIPDSVTYITNDGRDYPNLMIHCGKGTEAEKFAKESNCKIEYHTFDSQGVCTICGSGKTEETPVSPEQKPEQKPIQKPEQKPIQKPNENNQNIGNTQTTEVKANGIKITGPSKKVSVGKKIKLYAMVIPENTTSKEVNWSSSNPKVATVNQNGIVTVKKKAAGKSVVITAAAIDGSGVKATYKIKAIKGVVKKINVTGDKKVKAGKTLKLKAIVTATSGANKKIAWTSSNTKFATVSASGKVKTFKAGKGKKVKVTAMATDGSGKKKTVVIKIK